MKLFEIVSISLGLMMVVWVGYGVVVESKTPQPTYDVLAHYDDIEERSYPKLLIAETTVKNGSRKDQTSVAFRRLANYIFGGNKKGESIEMTAPVITAELMGQSEKIEMTAPVLSSVQKNDPLSYTMAFVLPSRFSKRNVPIPLDPSVSIKTVHMKKVYAYRFSGYVTQKTLKIHKAEMMSQLKDNKLSKEGELMVAQYHSPWVFPLFRKNELLLITVKQ